MSTFFVVFLKLYSYSSGKILTNQNNVILKASKLFIAVKCFLHQVIKKFISLKQPLSIFKVKD